MTDARLPERFLVDRRVLRLSDAERSSYFLATLWSVSNRTEGVITEPDIPFIPTFRPDAVPALIKAGLWTTVPGGWLDTEFEKNQTSREVLEGNERNRRAERDKKARQRAHKAGDHSRCRPDTCSVPGTVPGTNPGDVPRESIGQDRDRTGQAIDGNALQNSRSDQQQALVHDWPVVEIPRAS